MVRMAGLGYEKLLGLLLWRLFYWENLWKKICQINCAEETYEARNSYEDSRGSQKNFFESIHCNTEQRMAVGYLSNRNGLLWL